MGLLSTTLPSLMSGTGLTRRHVLKTGLSAGLVLAAGGKALAQGGGSLATPKRGGTLRFGLSADPSSYDPHIASGAAAATVKYCVYSTLLTYDSDANLIGDLVDEFGWLDDTTYEVRLKSGVLFHDGSTLRPDDILFSFERIGRPETAATNAFMMAYIDHIEAGDDNRIRFHLNGPNAVFPYLLADVDSGIVSRAWMEGGVDPKRELMGTGPFRFIEHQPGLSITLQRFEGYFLGDRPYLDGITFQPIADENGRVAALRAGTVDMIDYVPFAQMDLLESNGFTVASDAVVGVSWMGFRQEGPLADKGVRRAIAQGIDKDVLLRVAYGGRGSAIRGGLIPEGWLGYAPDLAAADAVNYDEAKGLLETAGHPSLALDVLTTSTYSVMQRPAIGAQQELAKVGINLNLTQMEYAAFRSALASAGVHVWSSAPSYNDPDFLTEFVGSEGFLPQLIGYSNSAVDKLLAEGRATVNDDAKRAEVYQEVQRLVAEDVPFVPLLRREQGEALAPTVRGYVHIAGGDWTKITLRDTWIDA